MDYASSDVRDELTADLRELLDFELAHGNEVAEILRDTQGWARKLVVVLRKPFRVRREWLTGGLPETLEWVFPRGGEDRDGPLPRWTDVQCVSRLNGNIAIAAASD